MYNINTAHAAKDLLILRSKLSTTTTPTPRPFSPPPSVWRLGGQVVNRAVCREREREGGMYQIVPTSRQDIRRSWWDVQSSQLYFSHISWGFSEALRAPA
eukprot:scaffold260435_cov32-Tisochrysis_lutea.AAC.1